MKRFAAVLLLGAFVYAQDEPETVEEEEEGTTWDSVKTWWSDKQDPVMWTSIEDNEADKTQCLLKGAYGWFGKAGGDYIFIRETVHGCEFPDESLVLTWQQMENPDKAGEAEGFYCTVDYAKGAASTGATDVYVKTLTGKLDFANWTGTKAEAWCEAGDTCERQSVDQWSRMLSDPQTNYPVDDQDDSLSAASCSAWRKAESRDNYMAIKLGTGHFVTTGYMIYANPDAFDAGEAPTKHGAGARIGMTFEGAGALAAGAMLAYTALAF